ncbi:hypothetical protein JCM12178A_07390 [Salidesulfovibrio brasiliensis]
MQPRAMPLTVLVAKGRHMAHAAICRKSGEGPSALDQYPADTCGLSVRRFMPNRSRPRHTRPAHCASPREGITGQRERHAASLDEG